MIGLTDRERGLAVTSGGPGTGICLALAELELYWVNHRKNAPDVHELRMSISIDAGGTIADRIGAVARVADWLGVPVAERYGVHIAQRRFTSGDDSVIIEAVYAPPPAEVDHGPTDALLDRLRAEVRTAREAAVA